MGRAALIRRIVNTQEEERGRISRELHDNLWQHLTAVMQGVQTLKMPINTWTEVTKMPKQIPQVAPFPLE